MKRKMIILGMFVILPLMAADFPEVKGWKREGKVRTYNPGNLWEYINGAAELFLAYGFESLQSCDLSQKKLVVTVDIYDMGDPLHAFGVFNTERPRDTKPLAIGAAGIVSPPYQCLLLKGTRYIKVNMYEGEIDEATGKVLLQALANALPGGDDVPEALTSLPQKDKKEGSEGFVKEGYLGLSELSNCIFADYKGKGDSEFQYFRMILGGKETVQSAWDRINAKWNATKLKDYPVLYKEIPYKGIVGVIRTDDELFGVTERGASHEQYYPVRCDDGNDRMCVLHVPIGRWFF